MNFNYPIQNNLYPIKNNCYNDVPIKNEYSNKEIRDNTIITNEFELNKDINLRMNDNNRLYSVYQRPTIPSASLYLESDQSLSGYYHKNPMTLSYEDPIINIKDSKKYNYINSDQDPSLSIENFDSKSNNKEKQTFFIFLIIFIVIIYLFFLR
jgi:hypothetical protein